MVWTRHFTAYRSRPLLGTFTRSFVGNSAIGSESEWCLLLLMPNVSHIDQREALATPQ